MQAQCEELNLDDSGKAFELRKRIEEYLDAGYGSCILKIPEIAQMIIQNWMHFDSQRYKLLAWVVMPNHVHVLIEPLNEWPLHKTIATWKTYTGKKIREWKQRGDVGELKKSQGGVWRSQKGQDGTWRSQKGQDGTWRSKESQDGAWRSKEGQGGTWRSEGRIWQREYWDRYMRNERHYWTTKAYIENNPVKAGLVKVPEEWPWSSAAVQMNVYSPW
jgi:REP element-mobilizing transposase RayT